jgi:hypothetical protein
MIFELLLDLVYLRNGVNLLSGISFLGVKVDNESSILPFIVDVTDFLFILSLLHSFNADVIDYILVVVELKFKHFLEGDGLQINRLCVLLA